MDAYEATKVVLTRIQALDPENAPKIMGRLLTQDHGDKDMIRLAFGPDSTLHTLVLKARNDMGLHRQTASPRLPPTSPSAWAPPPHFSRNDDLISPINHPCGSPLYGDLADEVQISDVFYQGQHRRTCSAADVCLVSEQSGWRPCVYFARGYCKNGSTCRFLHADDTSVDAAVAATPELLRSRSQLMASAYPYSPSSPSAKSLNLFLQHQNETQRAAAALLLGEDEGRTYIGRPRIERTEFAAAMLNPGSRQIYLTFPADSTFREEDVSNYFSIYGPVQDVRIPYQQKRMFGFVTFLYTETVKLILAKGNPHFVCDARVLVKPYKEKGKVPDKFRKQQQVEREDLYDQWSGARMQEVLLRRKLELQQAIELQGRRFSGLHLLDLETRSLSSPTNGAGGFYPRSVFSTPEQSPSPEDKSPSPPATGAPALSLNGGFLRQVLVNGSAAEIEESAGDVCNQEEGSSSFEQSVELNLPDSPFASPTRASSRRGESFSTSSSASEADLLAGSPDSDSSSYSNHSNLIDMAPFKACFLPIRQAAPY